LLLDEHYAEAGIVRAGAQGPCQALHDQGGEPEGQLVDEQDVRTAGQGAAHGQDLLLTTGEQAGSPVQQRLEFGEVGQGELDRAPADPQVVERRQAGDHGRGFRHQRQAAAGQLVQRRRRQASLPEHLTAGSRNFTHGCEQRGGLPGAVRAEHGDDLARVHVVGDVADGQYVAVPGR